MLRSMQRIDAHIHWNGDHPDWTRLTEELDLQLVNVCVVHDGRGDWRVRDGYTRERFQTDPSRHAWITSFDLPRFDDPDYADGVIAGLTEDLTAGAVGCKVWKNFGMEIKTPAGDWMMVDDPLLDPIFRFLAREGVPLLAHIGEPLACWQPLTPENPHYHYYSRNPEWHMHGREGFPSHRRIMDARDRMLARHTGLRVIGAHLGSLEYDVSEIAARLEAFPNFAVDTSARMRDLALQDSGTVRQFIERFNDRVLWGTDMVGREAFSAMTPEQRAERVASARTVYDREFAYYGFTDPVQIGTKAACGLGLPGPVLERLFRHNALEWYPRLTEQWS